ncbi:hypothetical protein D3C81_895000 [compost metagenome]
MPATRIDSRLLPSISISSGGDNANSSGRAKSTCASGHCCTVLRSFSVNSGSRLVSFITTDNLPMFSPLSVGLASSRVPVPETPYSRRTPSSLACVRCTSRTNASVCASGVPGGSLAVISKRSCANCGIRSTPNNGSTARVRPNANAAPPRIGHGRFNAAGSIRR